VPSTGVCLVVTVDSLAEGYSPRQIASAKNARKAMSMMGSPSAATFKLMVRDSLINNCPVTLDAIRVANNIFGPDAASLQGKMARRPPEHVDSELVDTRNLDVIVIADLMFVNGLSFFVSISRNITLITVTYMPSRTTADLKKGMTQIVLVYRRRGLTVTTAMVDNQFNPLRGLVGDVDLNITKAAKHAPEVERCIGMIKERVRAQKCRLSFTWFPAQMVIGLVSFCVFRINAFPHTNGVSQTLSPRTIITGQKLDYRSHCHAEFGVTPKCIKIPLPTTPLILPRQPAR